MSAERDWAKIEMFESFMRSHREAFPNSAISTETARNMTLEQMLDRYAAVGVRFDFHPSKRVD